MSPFHDHHEVKEWPETTIIVGFWSISGACVVAAIAIFVADFSHQAALP